MSSEGNRPMRSPRPQTVFSPRSTSHRGSGRRSDCHSPHSQSAPLHALADHVPNIQLGGPKGRPSTSSSTPDGSTPRDSLPDTMVSQNRHLGTSASARLAAQQQQWVASVSPHPSRARQGDSGGDGNPRSDATPPPSARSVLSSRTSSSSISKAPVSPRRASAVSGEGARPPVTTTTFTTGRRSSRGGSVCSAKGASSPSTSAPTSPRQQQQQQRQVPPVTKEEGAATAKTVPSPRGAPANKSIQHPYSLAAAATPPSRSRKAEEEKGRRRRDCEKENAAPQEKAGHPRPPPPPPPTHRASLSDTEEAPKTTRTAVVAAVSTAVAVSTPAASSSSSPRSSTASSSCVSVSAMKSARRPAAAADGRSSSGRDPTSSAARKKDEHVSLQRGEQDEDPVAREFFRFHYYYYPDTKRNGGGDTADPSCEVEEEEEEVGASEGAGLPSSLPGSTTKPKDRSFCSEDDVSELNDNLLTPPRQSFPSALAGEAPFTPSGMPPSPYMQRLAEATANSASRRFSPRQGGLVGTNSASLRSTSLRSGSGLPPLHHSPVDSAAALSRSRRQPPRGGEGEPEADEGDEEAAALCAQLTERIAAKRSELSQASHLLDKFANLVAFRESEKAMLARELCEVQQQGESLQTRAADVGAAAKELESKHHASEELAVLRDMLKEREQRLDTMEAKRGALSSLCEQLQFLHEEAQQQEARRREVRRQQRLQRRLTEEEEEEGRECEELTGEDGEDEERETSMAPSESERQIRRSMIKISRARTAVGGAVAVKDDSPLAPPREMAGDETTFLDGTESGGEWTDDEPDAPAPPSYSAPQRRRRHGQAPPSLSMSPSQSCARGPSVISAGTVDILQNFLAELYSEMEDLAMVCIQKPSPPAVLHSSRATRMAGASAWSRDINTGNNGFFSFFGGATEAHLSAKPLSTFLSCASRLARSAWRMEAELQLRARELATEEEDEDLRRRLGGKPAYEPAPVVELFSDNDDDDDDGEEERAKQDGEKEQGSRAVEEDAIGAATTAATPKRSLGDAAPAVLAASPELSRSASKRRLDSNGTGAGTIGSSPLSISSPVGSVKGGFMAPAPQIFLPSLAYAAPRLPILSRQLDSEQAAAQREYEQEIELQRTRRRCLVRRLKETYRNAVEPQLRQHLRAQQGRQEALARELVALGVAEVCLRWEEMGCEDDGDAQERAEAKRSRGGAWGGWVGDGATDAGREHEGNAANQQSNTARYLRQVVVRVLQVVEPVEAGDMAAASSLRRTSASSVSTSLDNVLPDALGLPIVSSTRHRLLPDPAPAPNGVCLTPRDKRPAQSANNGSSSLAVAGDRGLPLTPRSVTTTAAATAPLTTVLPMTPSPLKGRPARSASVDGNAGSQRSSRGTAYHHSQHRRGSPSSFSPTLTEETRQRLDAAGRPVRLATPLTPHRQQQQQQQRGEKGQGIAGRASAASPTVNLLGTHPAESAQILDSGAVKVSLLFFGDEARRRQREEAAKERHMKEFWALREELARADEANFILANRLQEAEERYTAQRCHHAMSMQEAMEKLSKMKRYHAAACEEREEWEDMHRELEAARDALQRERREQRRRRKRHPEE